MSQPESLRLADAWDQAISTRRHVAIGCEMADELRRLHAENETLKLQILKSHNATNDRAGMGRILFGTSHS